MTVIFDYDTFFEYYTNSDNLLFSRTNQTLYYYKKEYDLYEKTISDFSVDVRGVKLYVSWNVRKRDLYFSMPREIDGHLWDDHFHFAYSSSYTNAYRKNYGVPMISFSKTLQVPATHTKNNKTHKCNFRDKEEDLRAIQEILCTNHTRETKMSEKLSLQDLQILNEILTRPFVQNAGTTKIKYKNLSYKLHIGPKNGKYIVVKGKKHYLKK